MSINMPRRARTIYCHFEQARGGASGAYSFPHAMSARSAEFANDTRRQSVVSEEKRHRGHLVHLGRRSKELVADSARSNIATTCTSVRHLGTASPGRVNKILRCVRVPEVLGKRPRVVLGACLDNVCHELHPLRARGEQSSAMTLSIATPHTTLQHAHTPFRIIPRSMCPSKLQWNLASPQRRWK